MSMRIAAQHALRCMASPNFRLPGSSQPNGLDVSDFARHQPEQAAQPNPRQPQRQQNRYKSSLDYDCLTHEGFHRSSSLSSKKEMARDPPIRRALIMKNLHQTWLVQCVAQGTRCVKFQRGLALASAPDEERRSMPCSVKHAGGARPETTPATREIFPENAPLTRTASTIRNRNGWAILGPG